MGSQRVGHNLVTEPQQKNLSPLFPADSRYLQSLVQLIEPSNPISAFKSELKFLWRQHNNFFPTLYLEPDHHTVLCPRASEAEGPSPDPQHHSKSTTAARSHASLSLWKLRSFIFLLFIPVLAGHSSTVVTVGCGSHLPLHPRPHHHSWKKHKHWNQRELVLKHSFALYQVCITSLIRSFSCKT